jgi:DNA-binding NarL/FixJ family response regulator
MDCRPCRSTGGLSASKRNLAMAEDQRRRTVLVVDDHELVRLGLRQVIVQHFADRFHVAEAPNLEQALRWMQQRAEDVLVLLLDLNLGDTRGLTGLKLLRQLHPSLPIVVVSGTHDPRVREEALAHGAWGYFCKTGDAGDLKGVVATIESARAAGQGPRNGAVPASGQGPGPGIGLTGRQVQILELLLSGLDNQAIAAETGLALGSVKNCVSTIFLVFNVRSRAELIRLFA